MVSIKVALIVSLLLASFVAQVHSRECYECLYNKVIGGDADCQNNAAQSKFVSTCGISKARDFVPFAIGLQSRSSDYKCAVLETDVGGSKLIIRKCEISTTTCEDLKSQIPAEIPVEVTIEKCSFCDSDLCNASSQSSIAIFSLIPCFISYFIFK